MTKSKWGSLAAAAGFLCMYVFVLLALIHLIGTDAGLYKKLQLSADILPEAGISEETLTALDDALADYLRGDAAALDDTPFNETERTHMADCYELFVLLRRVISAPGVAMLVLLTAAYFLRCKRPDRAARIGAYVLGGLLLMLAAWGIFDFSSLFTAFHRLLFSNDLWLLDPATDLLIRICPESMFVWMAVLIGGGTLVWIAAVNVLLHRVFMKNGFSAAVS